MWRMELRNAAHVRPSPVVRIIKRIRRQFFVSSTSLKVPNTITHVIRRETIQLEQVSENMRVFFLIELAVLTTVNR
jgi:hypothetical protein